MFETLGDRLQNALHKIKGYGKITEDNISDMMREIRLALLEADVNYKVVKEFTNIVKEKRKEQRQWIQFPDGKQFKNTYNLKMSLAFACFVLLTL